MDPKASSASGITLYEKVRDRQVLLSAWRVIKANAEKSGGRETRKNAELFERHLIANIQGIQRRLRHRSYRFDQALGLTLPKGKNKPGKRAIVVATMRDRVVQRAILDVIYRYCSDAEIQSVLMTPTSVGGVPGRGIGDALATIEQSMRNGASYYVRSDIRDFFPSFPRGNVLAFLRSHIAETDFVDLFERAVTVELSNRSALGNDSDLFPLGDDGVAQGSPLSVLAGNIVLREFDKILNCRNVVCVRYIDDFLILAPSKSAADKALASGLAVLGSLKLSAYAPGDGTGKAESGPIAKSFDFLGYQIVRGLNPPSKNSCQKLLDKISAEIEEGKKWINRRLADGGPDVRFRQCYVQTLSQIDSILRGWAGAYQFTQSTQSLSALDGRIDCLLGDFERWYGAKVHKVSSVAQRRALGIRLLADSTPTPLPAPRI